MPELYIGNRTKRKKSISSATVVLAASNFVYDGTTKTQGVSSVTVNGVALVEGTDYTIRNNSQIDAGDYTLYLDGQGNYEGAATASWSIAKAMGSVSLSPTSLSLDNSNLTGAITVTRSGNGAITAQSSDTNVATVEVSGTSITVTAVASGSATVTVNVAAGTNHLATNASASVDVTLISSTLANNSPATIQAVAQAGTGAQYWSVGDVTAPISIGAIGHMAATSACAFIIGFNHNSSVEGTGIHFQFGKTTDGIDIAFVDSMYNRKLTNTQGYYFNMNETETNSGGWKSSNMRTIICSFFWSSLPSDWRSAIKNCKKWTDNTGGGSNTASYVTETTEEIFLLAEYEVFGTRSYANSAEKNKQRQYAYYANGNSTKKYRHDSIGTTCYWWLRSPHCSISTRFVVADINDAYHILAETSLGFAPGFVVG